MTAQDQMRKMLDQLMGQDRDGKTRVTILARFLVMCSGIKLYQKA